MLLLPPHQPRHDAPEQAHGLDAVVDLEEVEPLGAADLEFSPGAGAIFGFCFSIEHVEQAIGDADRVINGDDATRREPPAIDDLLVAPTVVGNQLYDVAAEERALGDAIFVLGRAVERGRLNPAVFARTTRSLAREWYLKKALVRKIGRGMGLVG